MQGGGGGGGGGGGVWGGGGGGGGGGGDIYLVQVCMCAPVSEHEWHFCLCICVHEGGCIWMHVQIFKYYVCARVCECRYV